MKTVLEEIANSTLSILGYDLVELRLGGSKRRPVVDLRIERRGGETVTIDDCARVSSAIGRRIDEEVPGLDDYVLEVSSPGVERPLRAAAEWRRFIGREVNVLSPVIGGRQELELIAVEGEQGSEVAVLRDKRGREIRVPLSEVKEARLAFHWKQR